MEVPEVFYKYRSSEGDSALFLRNQIERDELYFAAPYTFNDPFDCKPHFSFKGSEDSIKKFYYQALKKHDPSLNRADRRREAKVSTKSIRRTNGAGEAEARTKSYYFNKIQREIGAYCLTTVPDSILMWSHYANNHKGVCLEYCGLNEFFAEAQKVIYSEERPIINAFSNEDSLLMADRALLTKSDIWKYEDEWRIIAYTNGPGLYSAPNNVLKRIIIGANATQETIDLVKESVEKRQNKPSISHAKVDSLKYKILIQ